MDTIDLSHLDAETKDKAETLLGKIKHARQVEWNWPSARRCADIMTMCKEFEELTGIKCEG